MFELCSLLCLKLYSLNFAIAHAQKKIMLIRIRHTCVALLQRKTVLSLETSSEINFEFIKFVKKGKCLPLKKTNREYYINITFPDWVIVENIISGNHIPWDDIFDYHPIRECNMYFIIPNSDPLFSIVLGLPW